MLRAHTKKTHACPRLLGLVLLAWGTVALLALSPLVPRAAAAGETMPTPQELDAYLSSKGSPMAGDGAAFVASGGRWKVDPRLLVAISGAESNFGQITCAPYNGWGWGCPNGPYAFTSWADAIETVTRGLRTGYLAEGRTSVALIQQKYAPSGAANDPTGLNNHWVANVSRFLLELGGNPNDVDMDGVAGSMPLGVEVDSAAPDYDFRAQQESAAERSARQQLVVRAGSATPVRIRLANTGSQVWQPSAVRLRRVDVEQRVTSAPVAALEQQVERGGRASFAIDLRASGSRAGNVRTIWRLEGPGGAFGPEIVRDVSVKIPSLVAGETRIEAPAVLPAGSSATAVVRVQNAGSDPWLRDATPGVVLGVRASSGPTLLADGWRSPQVPAGLLERRVEPGAWGTFAFRVTMPQGAVEAATMELLPFAGSTWASGESARFTVAPQ